MPLVHVSQWGTSAPPGATLPLVSPVHLGRAYGPVLSSIVAPLIFDSTLCCPQISKTTVVILITGYDPWIPCCDKICTGKLVNRLLCRCHFWAHLLDFGHLTISLLVDGRVPWMLLLAIFAQWKLSSTLMTPSSDDLWSSPYCHHCPLSTFDVWPNPRQKVWPKSDRFKIVFFAWTKFVGQPGMLKDQFWPHQVNFGSCLAPE